MKSQSKAKTGVSDLQTSDGNLARTDAEKAETLNAYFGSVFSQEDVSIIMPGQELRSETTISDVAFTSQHVDCLLAHMAINKSPGPDGIHSRVLREAHEEVCEPLRMIFTKLLREGVVPKSWKQATVVPIFKMGKKSNIS